MGSLSADQIVAKLNSVRSALEDQKVSVSDTWLENTLRSMGAFNERSCVNEKHVYRKWLKTDLAESTVAATTTSPADECDHNQRGFPPNTFTERSTCINGELVIQVNSIKDISKPPINNENDFLHIEEEATEGFEDFDADAKWNKGGRNNHKKQKVLPGRSQAVAKAPRTLLLDTTDGSRLLKALEYRPISVLSPELPIGCKLLLKGPIEVHNATMMLQPDNITEVMGGEVNEPIRPTNEPLMPPSALIASTFSSSSSSVATTTAYSTSQFIALGPASSSLASSLTTINSDDDDDIVWLDD